MMYTVSYSAHCSTCDFFDVSCCIWVCGWLPGRYCDETGLLSLPFFFKPNRTGIFMKCAVIIWVLCVDDEARVITTPLKLQDVR